MGIDYFMPRPEYPQCHPGRLTFKNYTSLAPTRIVGYIEVLEMSNN